MRIPLRPDRRMRCPSAIAAAASAQETKVAIGISGWTGFAPLTLAKEAGIFKKNGVDVSIKKIPQKDRHLAIASGDVQCAATTVETYVVWNANGVPITQVVQLDKSYGADGLAVRNNVAKIADLKGKTVGVDAPGTSPYFGLAWILKKNGLSMKDVTVATMSPQAAAQAFVAGQNDAAMTYEPYLSIGARQAGLPARSSRPRSTIRWSWTRSAARRSSSRTIPKAVKAMVDSYFEALEMIKKDPAKSYEIMGADVKQTGEQFAKSAAYLRWQDKAANQQFFTGRIPGVQQGSRRPAARARHHQSRSRT